MRKQLRWARISALCLIFALAWSYPAFDRGGRTLAAGNGSASSSRSHALRPGSGIDDPKGRLRSGLEEKLGKRLSASEEQSKLLGILEKEKGISRVAQLLLGGSYGLSQHIFAEEAAVLRTREKETFFLGRGFAKPTPSESRHSEAKAEMVKLLERLESRRASYQAGRLALDTLPALARLLILYGSERNVVTNAALYVKLTEEELKQFVRFCCDSEGRVSPQARENLPKILGKVRGQTAPRVLKPDGVPRAIEDIEALIRSQWPTYRRQAGESLGRNWASKGARASAVPPLPAKRERAPKDLGQEWHRRSLALVDKWIEQAPLRGRQPVGYGTRVRVRDLPADEDRLFANETFTLERLKARLQPFYMGLVVAAPPEKGQPGVELQIQRYAGGVKGVPSRKLQERIDTLPPAEQMRADELFPAAGGSTGSSAGLEEKRAAKRLEKVKTRDQLHRLLWQERSIAKGGNRNFTIWINSKLYAMMGPDVADDEMDQRFNELMADLRKDHAGIDNQPADVWISRTRAAPDDSGVIVDIRPSPASAAGLEEQQAVLAVAREFADGFESVSRLDSKPVIVIGKELAERLRGLQVYAALWSRRMVIDRGDLYETLTQAAQRGDTVYFYGDLKRGRRMSALAHRAGMQLSFVLRNPANSTDRLLLRRIFKDLQVPSDVVSSGLEEFTRSLQKLGEAA